MGERFGNRLQHAWNAFIGRDPTNFYNDYGYSASYRPDRIRLNIGNERSIITSVYNKIALDISTTTIKHVRLDKDDRYLDTIKSGLNDCLGFRANIDQTGRAFIQDIIMSMFDEGCVAIVPVDTTINPNLSSSFDIQSMRTGKIVQWYPQHVRVRLYNEKTGLKQEVTLPKEFVGIVENPLYSVMNEPNSTLQRLIAKLNLLDAIDNQSGSGKLDLIIQVPYSTRTEARKKQAEDRRKEIEVQLQGSKYGIAYTDGTEKVTQLNRPAENNLMTQVQYLTSTLFSQLGLTQGIFDGTADETAMLNYFNSTCEPCIMAVVDEMKSKFLTKTARSQQQSIMYFRNSFKLVPVKDLAEVVDKFTRNEVMTSNEFRSIMGLKPSKDPGADKLRNKNLNPVVDQKDNNPKQNPPGDIVKKEGDKVNEV